MADPFAAAPWLVLVDAIEAGIRRVGYWSGEARNLRDAAGFRRLTPGSCARIVSALANSGYECDPPDFLYESDPLMIGRIGAAELARTIEALLPAIREADRVVSPVATWRDATVAREALKAWPGTGSSGGSTRPNGA
jgi:hypothetical protein